MKKVLLLMFSFFCYWTAMAQDSPPFDFWKDIQHFKTADSTAFPPSGQILFIGSSSFTKWTDVNDYFPGYHILNRGFGGSRLLDLICYRYDIIYPYAPRQIVIYCGENDLAAGDHPSVETVVDRFKVLLGFIRDKYPRIPLLYVAIKPSISRKHLWPAFRAANEGIARLLKSDGHATFVDVYALMFDTGGRIREDIFIEDKLHMNAKGYSIWKKALEPHLLRPE
ncbi:SGNH/GDSL hydrolase family protein [Niabella terrae]